MQVLKEQDFNLTTNELVKALEYTEQHILTLRKEGAFPYINEGKKYLYHKDCIKMTNGDVQRNRRDRRYVEPVFGSMTKRDGMSAIAAKLEEILSEQKQINQRLEMIESVLFEAEELVIEEETEE